ncbi:flippase [Desulfosporosinus sp. FKA]|uniref:flippase n=1 Tax=Desulfosporosinus sp. FKA TaxID=1969834 RepID=UPI000B4A231D|nr:flippase [Desulfosporosinus sp. FKA]
MNGNKSLAKNSVYNVVYKLLNVLFPLLTATYVARVLLAAGVGKVSYAQNIVAYFTAIAALGIPNYGTKEIAMVRENKNKINKLFTELFLINFISTLVCTIAYYTMIFSVNYFQENIQLYIVVGFAIILNVINVDWFYQGIEEYAYIALRSFGVKLVSLFCIFMFIRTPEDISIYATIYCLGIGGNNIFNIINLKKHNVRFSIAAISVKRHLKPIFILLASVMAVGIYTMLDTTMIGIMCQDTNVGYYTNAMRLVKILISVVTAIGGVLLPRLSYYHSQGMNDECSKVVSKVFSIMLFLFLPCEIGLFLVAGQVMPLLFGESFAPGVMTLRLASLLIGTLGFSNLFGTQVLLTFGAEKKLLIATITGAVTNIVLNLILIPKLAQNGAVIASVISETLVTVVAVIFSSKYIKIYLNRKLIISLILASIGLATSVLCIQSVVSNVIVKLSLSVVMGASVYMLINIATKNPIIGDVLAIVKKK